VETLSARDNYSQNYFGQHSSESVVSAKTTWSHPNTGRLPDYGDPGRQRGFLTAEEVKTNWLQNAQSQSAQQSLHSVTRRVQNRLFRTSSLKKGML
jgi:DNA-binding sugar fermentation-stimulating protein